MKYRGSVTIEAALILPIVFYAMLVLFGLMSYLHMDYQIHRIATDVAIEFSYDSYLVHELGLTDLIAHHSKQRQSLMPMDLVEAKEQVDQTIYEVQSNGVSEEWLQSAGQLMEMSKTLVNKAGKLPGEINGVVKSEGTILASRLLFDNYFKYKIKKRLSHISSFRPGQLRIKSSYYYHDFKASELFVSYLYDFPVRIPFLKQAEIVCPIYVENFVGNIPRYDGSKYKEKEVKKEEEDKQIVYITENGERYHTLRQCTSIYTKYEKVEKLSISKGKECKVCAKKGFAFSDFVFKTKASDTYHASEKCTKLNYNVMEITLEEAENRGLTHCGICQNGGDLKNKD